MSGSPPPAAAFSNSGGGKKAVHVKVSTSGGHCVVGFILANIRNRVFWGQGHMTWSRDHHLDPHIKRKRGKERVKTGAGHRERWTEAMLRYKHTYNSTWLFVGFPRPATTFTVPVYGVTLTPPKRANAQERSKFVGCLGGGSLTGLMYRLSLTAFYA